MRADQSDPVRNSGETNVEDEVDEFMEKLKNLKDLMKSKRSSKRDIKFSNNGKSDTRKPVLRTYIETMFEVPWKKDERRFHRLDHAQQVLIEIIMEWKK